MNANDDEQTKEGLGFRLAEDRLKDTHQRLAQLVLQIVLRVDRKVVLEDIDRILRFLQKWFFEFEYPSFHARTS